MTFDFIAIEAHRQALVRQYGLQRDERRTRERGNVMTSEELAAIKARAEAATEDRTFIAHARTDVPALVAEVERLRGALERLGSSEAFTYAMAINTDDPREEELRARLDFARDAMK